MEEVDESWYLEMYPAAKLLGIDAKSHYQRFGKRLGYKPNAGITQPAPAVLVDEAESLFNKGFYAEANPDVVAAGLDLWHHYQHHGWRENRQPNEWFSPAFYLRNYHDVRVAGIEPFTHYVRAGRSEGRYASYSAFYADRVTRYVHENRPILLPAQPEFHGKFVDATICVHVHCYYVDVFVDEIVQSLKKLPYRPTIFVSICSQDAFAVVERALVEAGLKIGRIALVENRGRDLAPMICEFAADIETFDLCLHVHTKKSKEKLDVGARWLRDIQRTLFRDANTVGAIVDLVLNDPSIGLLGPRPYKEIVPFMTWGSNRVEADRLLSRAGLKTAHPQGGLLNFPAGSFFWFRPRALKSLFNLNLQVRDFPAEPIADDGTIAHAIERILPDFCTSGGFRQVLIGALPPEANWPAQMKSVVSIIIPAYNAAAWIEEAVQSVVAQTAYHCPTEIIIVDNNSRDGTLAIAERMAALNPRIRVFSETKQGAGAARNLGINMAQGRYIGFLDADDLLLPDALSVLYDAMCMDDDIDFTTSSLVMFDHDGISRAMPFPDSGEFIALDKDANGDGVELWTRVFPDFGPCAKLYKKTFLVENGILFAEKGNFEDNQFIASVYMKAKKAIIVQAVTYLYRRTETLHGGTQSSIVSEKALRDQFKVGDTIVASLQLLTGDPYARAYAGALARKVQSEVDRMALGARSASVLDEYPQLKRLMALEFRHYDLAAGVE